MAFDIETLVTDLRAAATQDRPQQSVRSVLQTALADPVAVNEGIPDYAENEVVLFEDDSISIWFCRFLPGQTVPAHDHQMHATIGVYRGAERNEFFETAADGVALQKSNEVVLEPGKVLQIGPDAIHAVSCASAEPSLAIHVYLGKLTTVDRSLFDTDTGEAMAFSDDNYERLTRADQG
ncbi:MAG: hypothetical protein AAF666_04975 [Pseudomonadota bacterium]